VQADIGWALRDAIPNWTAVFRIGRPHTPKQTREGLNSRVWRLRWTGLFLWFQLAARKTSPNIRFSPGAFLYKPCRRSARLEVESELLTGAANAIVKT
jgi:hypothetical protein